MDANLEKTAKRNTAEREKANLITSFRRLFGSDPAHRTPDQKIVWDVLQRRIETPVFTANSHGQVDSTTAALNEGQRMFARQIMTLATTPLADQVEKPIVTK